MLHLKVHLWKMILWVGFMDYLVLGFITATFTYYISNKYLIHTSELGKTAEAPKTNFDQISDQNQNSSNSSFLVTQTVEWFYSFDVHCNSFFPVFLILHVFHFFLLPLILFLGNSIFSTLLANSIFLLAFFYYYYITFLGFTSTFF